MNKAVPWSVKGVDFDARAAAKEAARRAGMTLGEWLNSVIAEQAAEQGLNPDEIDDDERVAAVRSRLERLSPADRPGPPGLRRRGDRPAARMADRDESEDEGHDERPRAGRRFGEPSAWRETSSEISYDGRAEALLEEAARSFERRARRDSAATTAALDQVARRLESLEGRLDSARPEPASDHALRRVISRLESRIEALAAREDQAPAPLVTRHFPAVEAPAQVPSPHHPAAPVPPIAPVHAPVAPPPAHPASPASGAMRPSDLARIEAKLNRLLDRETMPRPAAVEAPPDAFPDRPSFDPVAPRRSMRDAIAEINRRQSQLDRDHPRGATAAFAGRAVSREGFPAPVTAPSVSVEQNAELRTTVAALKGEIADLSRHIETLRLEAQKPEVIAASVRDAIASHARGPDVEELRRQLADMSLAIGRLAPREGLLSLEAAIGKLGEQVAHSRNDGARENLLAPVEQLVSDMKRALADFAPRGSVDAIRREIETIRQSVESAANSGIDPEAFGQVCAQTAEIRNLLAAAVSRPVPLENIEKQISALTKRVDLIATRGMTPVGVSAVNESVGEIRAAMEAAGPTRLLVALEARIEELARKIDEAAARPSPALAQLETISSRLDSMNRTLAAQAERQTGSSPAVVQQDGQLDDIAQRLASMQQTLAWQAERQPAAKVDMSLLEGMLQQIMEKVSRPAPEPAAPLEIDRLERALRDIAARVETLAAQADNEGVAGLEERIDALAVKLDRPEFNGLSLGEIEQTLSHLASQLEENRLSAIDAASNAARLAARDVLVEFAKSGQQGAIGSLDVARDLIAREIDGLRALQDASDRRTHATLGAVHETLEKVVDRLAMLEEDFSERGDEGSAGRRGQTAPGPAHPAGHEQLASGPAPVFSRPDSHLIAKPAAEPVAAQITQAPAVSPADVLIEPGSGRKPEPRGVTVGQALAAESQDPPVHGRAAASNFIAAARRAQQAAQAQAQAQAEAAAAPAPVTNPTAKSATPDYALAEARNRAKAAASLLSGSLKKRKAEPAAETSSAPEPEAKARKSLQLFSSRKVLFSLAGLVLVLGALTILRQNMARPAPPRPVAAAPAQTVAPAPQPPAALVAPAATTELQTSGANSAAPTQSERQPQAQTPPAPSARTDRSPVSSIPTFINGAGPAPAANDLRLAAAAGDPRAQYELAVRMFDGRHEKRDPAGAFQLLEQAAQKGFAPAQYRLGSLYEKGVGIEKSLAQARHWYEQAASAGNVKAMHNLAVLLAEGGDAKPDYATAANWFRKAAEHGVRDSQYNLAILFARGLGVEQSLTDAYVWLSLAEAQGDADAADKRRDVAKRLSPGQLSAAQERVARFRVLRAQPAANEATPPPGGWRVDPPAAQAPASSAPGAGPANAPRARSPAVKRPQVSSL